MLIKLQLSTIIVIVILIVIFENIRSVCLLDLTVDFGVKTNADV